MPDKTLQEVLKKFQNDCDTILTYSSIESNDSRSWDWEVKEIKEGYEIVAKFGLSDEGDDHEIGDVKYHIPKNGIGIDDAWVMQSGQDWESLEELETKLGVKAGDDLPITALLHNYLAGYSGPDMVESELDI